MRFNIPVLLIGRMFAERDDDSPRDIQRASFLPALIPNPFLGIAIAMTLAKRGERTPAPVRTVAAAPVLVSASGAALAANAAPPPPPPAAAPPAAPAAPAAAVSAAMAATSSSGISGTTAATVAAAEDIMRARRLVAHLIPHDFFPSFVGLDWRQALRFSQLAELTPHAQGERDGTVVTHQEPKPGDDWPKGLSDVTLYFGMSRP